MPLIEMYQAKWHRKTIAAVQKWVDHVSRPETFQAYVGGISAVTGLPESEIASSLPAKNYREFQTNAAQFAEKFRTKVEKAASIGKWAKNYVEAFRAK